MADDPDVELIRALKEWADARSRLFKAKAAEARTKDGKYQGYHTHAMELNQLSKYLRSVEKTIHEDAESADPVRKLERWTERTERRRRTRRKAQAEEVDDRVTRLGSPKS